MVGKDEANQKRFFDSDIFDTGIIPVWGGPSETDGSRSHYHNTAPQQNSWPPSCMYSVEGHVMCGDVRQAAVLHNTFENHHTTFKVRSILRTFAQKIIVWVETMYHDACYD